MQKIDELYYPRDDLKRANSRFDVRWFLRTNGFKKFGEGAYADVYSHPSLNYVLKVFTADDIAYRSYYAMIQNHPNIHFPIFKGKMIGLTETVYALRMEKLRMTATLPISISYSKLKRDIMKATKGDYTLPSIITDAYPHLQEACNLIKNGAKSPIWVDTHQDNIMFRGNIPVITDAWSAGTD